MPIAKTAAPSAFVLLYTDYLISDKFNVLMTKAAH